MMLFSQFEEKTSKIILVICVLFILILFFFGFLRYVINKYMEKESKKLDGFMIDLLKNDIVKNSHQFKKAYFYTEKRLFYNKSKWCFRVFFFVTALAFIAILLFFNSQYSAFFKKAFELLPTLKWPTIKETNELLSQVEGAPLLKGPGWMPATIIPSLIYNNPDFTDPMLFTSMIYYIIILICLFSLAKAILAHVARKKRCKKIAPIIFNDKNIKEDLYVFSQSINSKIPNQEKYEIKDTK